MFFPQTLMNAEMRENVSMEAALTFPGTIPVHVTHAITVHHVTF